jgi:predicted  nucleic acid-binding Zn-ribbon protein
MVVFCWQCGVHFDRDETGMYAPCDMCGSTNVHATRSIEDSAMTADDVKAAVSRHRGPVTDAG